MNQYWFTRKRTVNRFEWLCYRSPITILDICHRRCHYCAFEYGQRTFALTVIAARKELMQISSGALLIRAQALAYAISSEACRCGGKRCHHVIRDEFTGFGAIEHFHQHILRITRSIHRLLLCSFSRIALHQSAILSPRKIHIAAMALYRKASFRLGEKEVFL
jgi:hypothetical protein